MNKENSALEVLLDRINDLIRRVEELERRVLTPTYTNITRTPTSDITRTPTITAIGWSYWDLWWAPTINIWATPHEPYWASIIDRYQSRLDELENQLADMQWLRFDARDGNLYVNYWTNDWEGEGE